jgi:hypothetical protein
MKRALLATTCCLLIGTAVGQGNLPIPPPRIPQHEVHLYLTRADYARLLGSFDRATAEPNGLRLVKLDLKEARMLMTSIFVAQQGVVPKSEPGKAPK